MSTWYYYNEQGEKVSVSGGQLKGLAKAGLITPETVVETEEGKKAPARKVKGLTFIEKVQPEQVSATTLLPYNGVDVVPPATEEVYGLEPHGVNPFTAHVPEAMNSSEAVSPESNPFTISLQEAMNFPDADSSKMENPFVGVQSAEVKLFTMPASEAVNPFTAVPSIDNNSLADFVPVIKISRTARQSAPASVAEEDENFAGESTKSSKISPIVLGPIVLGIVLLALVVFWVSVSYPELQRREREAEAHHQKQMMEEKYQSEKREAQIERESQLRQARIRADAEITKKRNEISAQKARNSVTMNAIDYNGEAKLLDWELREFENRKEMELLQLKAKLGL